MDVVGYPGDAKYECERLFAAAWYDAFGLRGSPHVGRFVEERASRPIRPLGVLTRALKYSRPIADGVFGRGVATVEAPSFAGSGTPGRLRERDRHRRPA